MNCEVVRMCWQAPTKLKAPQFILYSTINLSITHNRLSHLPISIITDIVPFGIDHLFYHTINNFFFFCNVNRCRTIKVWRRQARARPHIYVYDFRESPEQLTSKSLVHAIMESNNHSRTESINLQRFFFLIIFSSPCKNTIIYVYNFQFRYVNVTPMNNIVIIQPFDRHAKFFDFRWLTIQIALAYIKYVFTFCLLRPQLNQIATFLRTPT